MGLGAEGSNHKGGSARAEAHANTLWRRGLPVPSVPSASATGHAPVRTGNLWPTPNSAQQPPLSHSCASLGSRMCSIPNPRARDRSSSCRAPSFPRAERPMQTREKTREHSSRTRTSGTPTPRELPGHRASRPRPTPAGPISRWTTAKSSPREGLIIPAPPHPGTLRRLLAIASVIPSRVLQTASASSMGPAAVAVTHLNRAMN